MEAQKIGELSLTEKRQSRYQVNHGGEAQILDSLLTVTLSACLPWYPLERAFCLQQAQTSLAQLTQRVLVPGVQTLWPQLPWLVFHLAFGLPAQL